MLKRPASISLRLTLWFGCALFAGWTIFGVMMWASLRRTLTNERHQTLTRRLDRLQDLLLRDHNASPTDREGDFADFAHATGNGLMEVFRPDGARLLASPSSAARSFPWPRADEGAEGLFLRIHAGGQTYWVLARSVQSDGQSYVLMAAAPDAGNLLVMNSFVLGLLAACPVLLLISSAGGYWLSRRALRPVDSITATARSISFGNLTERVPVSPTGDELQRLAETCNAMLDRLQSSVNQIKRFTADASHELRGPLSFARTVAEIALLNQQADPESRRAFQDIVQEMSSAAILLEDMLTLARADAMPASLPRRPVSLADIVREVCKQAEPLAEQRGVTLSTHLAASDAIVMGDDAGLKRLLWILLDNAIKYSRETGRIDVFLTICNGFISLSVQDDGIGIDAADIPFIFDRFYRADPSRGIVEGTGLGLAIAKWTAEAHGAAISAQSQPGAGTTFLLEFPPN